MSLLQGKSRAKTGRRVIIDLQKAERAFKDGHLKEVEQLCGEVLEERPDSCQACLLMAELRFRQERYDDVDAWITRARETEADNPRGLNLLGRMLLRGGDLPGAEAAFRRAIEGAPGYAEALANLGHVLLEQGHAAEAEQHFHRAIEHDREHGLANLSLGKMYYEQGRPDLAVPYLQTGIQRELYHRPGQYMLAVALWELGRLDESITAFRRLVASDDRDPEVYSGLARALEGMGELELAQAGYEAALEFAPGHAAATAGLAVTLVALGRPGEALASLSAVVQQEGAEPCLHVAHARALQAMGRPAEALLHLAELVQRPAPDAALAPAHRLLGELLDARGEHARAFAQHRRANRLRRTCYDPAAHTALVSRLIEVFDRELLDALPRGSDSEVPVFVIGLPCAGESRVARLIAGHARAASAGALPHIDLGAGRTSRYNNSGLAYPECISALRERELRELSAAYLARLFAAGEGARRIADAMWLNVLHVGLIELMFPRARLIHCRRDPLDVGLGCHFRFFDGMPAPFSGAFEDFGSFHADYLRLMEHWRATTRLPMLEVEYAALSQDPAAEGRRIIEFLGLAWDEGLVERAASTVDPEAACEGRAGWHLDYAAYLGPLRDSLAAAGCPMDAAS
jgi:tetratricopeptide (TPR) repeat protein